MIAEKQAAETMLERTPLGYGGLFYAAYPAIVRDIVDPEGQGRVKIALPWSPDTGDGVFEVWARLATMMAGDRRGTFFIPDVDDEVLVVFLGGRPDMPCVIGALWNGQDSPPLQMDGAGRNNEKQICSRNGVKVTLIDEDGRESLVLETPGGQKVELTDSPAGVAVSDSNGNRVELASAGITVRSPAKVSVEASTAEISASMLTVNAGMSKFSGVVQADVVITNTVVSATYTPGAGNIW